MVRQHWLNGYEFEQTPGDSGGLRSLACCSPWGHKVGHKLATKQEQQKQVTLISSISKISQWWLFTNDPSKILYSMIQSSSMWFQESKQNMSNKLYEPVGKTELTTLKSI